MEHEAEFLRKSIRLINRYFEKRIQKQTVELGFTVPQMRVIREVISHQSISIKQLSQNLQMTQSTVSGIVERLIEKDILQKKKNSYDRRAVEISTTENVTKFMQNDRTKFVNKSVESVLNRLNPEDHSQVMHGIRLLLSAIEDAENEEDQN